jgi:hypothetical protein
MQLITIKKTPSLISLGSEGTFRRGTGDGGYETNIYSQPMLRLGIGGTLTPLPPNL